MARFTAAGYQTDLLTLSNADKCNAVKMVVSFVLFEEGRSGGEFCGGEQSKQKLELKFRSFFRPITLLEKTNFRVSLLCLL
jgi:hypothetical protein